MNTDYDRLEIRCPLLGHPLQFSYCRIANLGEPCRKILDCWFERFPVEEFIKQNYSEQVFEKIIAMPKPKMLSILEIVQRAQAANKNGDNSDR